MTQSDLKITTNNVPRPIINAWELTPSERKEFDYYDWDKIDGGSQSATFIRYKGELYDLGDFSATDYMGMFSRWHGIMSDSFFSGLVIRYPYSNDYEFGDYVIVGRYCT